MFSSHPGRNYSNSRSNPISKKKKKPKTNPTGMVKISCEIAINIMKDVTAPHLKWRVTPGLLFCSCFRLFSPDHLEGVPVVHALGHRHPCWWRVCPGRWLWGNILVWAIEQLTRLFQRGTQRHSSFWHIQLHLIILMTAISIAMQ